MAETTYDGVIFKCSKYGMIGVFGFMLRSALELFSNIDFNAQSILRVIDDSPYRWGIEIDRTVKVRDASSRKNVPI